MMGVTLAFSPTEAAATRAGPLSGLAVAGLGALLIATGVGLRKLRPWSRIASGIWSGLGRLCNREC